MAGTKPSLEQAPGWNKLRVGTTLDKKKHALTGEAFWLEQPPAWKKLWAGTKSLLETAPGWKQPLAGNSPWLETAPGWKQPLAGNSLWLETASGWKISSKSLHALDMPQDYFCSCKSFAKLSGKLPKVFNTTSAPCRESNIFLLPYVCCKTLPGAS